MVEGGLVPLAAGIIEQQPPALVDTPPLQSRREQARAAMWSRVAARGANLRRMTNANEDSEDAQLTRGVVRSVMAESRGAASAQEEAGAASSALADDGGSEDEMVRELEQEMASEAPKDALSEASEAPEDALARLLEGLRRIEEAESSRAEW